MSRPSWTETFLAVADEMAKRATCPRLHVGAVLVKDNSILTTGYNGAPKGMPHCTDVGCLMIENHCKRTIHAERNAILFAAKRGPSIEGAEMFLTHSPCFDCLTLMIGAGIRRITFREWYPKVDDQVVALAMRGKVALFRYDAEKGYSSPVPFPDFDGVFADMGFRHAG